MDSRRQFDQMGERDKGKKWERGKTVSVLPNTFLWLNAL